jgi:hypothetical protein
LVHVELDEEYGHGLLELGVVSRGSVDGLGDVLEDKVEEDFILLVAIRVEESLEIDYVGVLDNPHDLKLAVLEALILQDLLDGNFIALFAGTFGRFRAGWCYEFCLENNTETSVPDDFAVGVGDLSLLSGLAVRGKNLDDLVGIIERCDAKQSEQIAR